MVRMAARSPGTQRETVHPEQTVLDGREVLPVDRLGWRGLGERAEEVVGGRLGAQASKARGREQHREKLRPVARQLEDCLVHELQVQVAAADVEDDRGLRADGGNIGEVLLGTDAQVDAACLRPPDEIRDHALEAELVRREVGDVLRSEIAARLGGVGDELPERLVGQPQRQVDNARRWRQDGADPEDAEDAEDAEETAAGHDNDATFPNRARPRSHQSSARDGSVAGVIAPPRSSSRPLRWDACD